MSAHTHEVPSQEVPTRFQRMLWPSIGVGVTLATTAYVRQVDPNQPGHYLPCPLKFVTGIDCPACGGLRCVHSLTNGDIVGALDHNALAVVVLPLIAVAVLFALRRRWIGPVQPSAAEPADQPSAGESAGFAHSEPFVTSTPSGVSSDAATASGTTAATDTLQRQPLPETDTELSDQARAAARRQKILMTALIIVTLAFTVARNIPSIPFLNSAIG
ncbi:MAG: DUF2752 domain-containing protein [Candidatus Nanopelagicales bacterium]|nr:DUF2752 domain-containing protein [Candidatus Nanopelagicales bacterium]